MSVEKITEKVIEFVPLLDHEDYEILNDYPFTIRRKDNHYEISECDNGEGYIAVALNGIKFKKHRLIALQFLPNDDPEHKTVIDHINHDRSDNHLYNLRWSTHSSNSFNKKYFKNINYRYVDTIPEDATVVDFYDTRTERHEFEHDVYYYHDGLFYYNNDYNYRVLNINENKSGNKFVRVKTKNNKHISLYIHVFLEQHDLI